MKKISRRKGCLGCMGVVLVVGMFIYFFALFATEKWIEDSTGFEIPFLRNSFSARSTDVGVGAFLKVSRKKATDLIQAHDFYPCEGDPLKSVFGGLYSARRIPVDPFPPIEELRILHGASKWKSWGIYAHEPTGRFWIVVLHADMAGDPPPGALGAP